MYKSTLKNGLILLCNLVFGACYAQEWSQIPVPANPGTGKMWELQGNVSDDFNYIFNETNAKTNFGTNNKWYNFYHNQWDGPGTSYWKYNHVSVDGDNLVLKASRWDKNNQPNPQYTGNPKMNMPNDGINLACVTSNNRVKYPVFVESAISIANIKLATCFWLLSPDDTQEIDIIENYGSVPWFRQFTHISHHSFIRNPFHDYQPRDINSWYPDSRVSDASGGWGAWSWNGGNRQYLRLGVYWISPNHFEYYIDGQIVRVMYHNAIATNYKGTWQYTYYNGVVPAGTTDQWGQNIGGRPTEKNGYSDVTIHSTSATYDFAKLQAASTASKGINVIDPGNYQNGTGFTKEMDIIINFESQSWLAQQHSPTTAELNDVSRNQMRVDWVRVYKPINDPNAQNDRDRLLDFNNKESYIPANATLPTVTKGELISINLDYATAYKNNIEEDLYYIATELRLVDNSGAALKRSAFNVSVLGDAENQGNHLYNFTIPSVFSDGTEVPVSSELTNGQRLVLTIYMSVNQDEAFHSYQTDIIVNDVILNLPGQRQNLKGLIYPNPTSGNINLPFSSNKWTVFNIAGEKILETNEQEIDMSRYPKGLYFFHSGGFVEKIVVK